MNFWKFSKWRSFFCSFFLAICLYIRIYSWIMNKIHLTKLSWVNQQTRPNGTNCVGVRHGWKLSPNAFSITLHMKYPEYNVVLHIQINSSSQLRNTLMKIKNVIWNNFPLQKNLRYCIINVTLPLDNWFLNPIFFHNVLRHIYGFLRNIYK